MDVHRERLCEFSRVWEADATAVSSLLALQQQQQASWSIADASAVSVTHGALFLRGNDVSTSTLQISIGLDGNKTLHRLSLRTQLPQNGATLKLQLPEQYGHITMAIGTTSNSSEMFIGSSQNTSVVAELPCVADVADAYHDVEFVWDDQWLRWYVDETLLLEEFIFQTKESKNSRMELELSVEGSDVTLAVERMTLSSGNASDRYCTPRYSTSSNCRAQESLSPRLGSVQGSLSVAEVEAFIDEVAAAFPIITKVEDLGRSVEGRPLRALCLGACYAPEDQMTPQALFTGMHHAREPVSMMNLVYTINILTTDYRNGDLAALELLASRQLWFILVVNPDGYAHNEMARVWEHNKMGQRKSGAPTCDRSPPDAGVDLNRNYDVCFARDAKGSSNKPCGDDYNGPSAFSEPETQAVRDLVERNTTDFSVALNYHSYGKYFNLPFACQAEGEPTEPNNSVFRALAQEMAYFNGFSYGQSWKDSNLYTVNGETSDWMWQAHGIFAMSPEVGPGFEVQSVPGFWPPPDQIPQLSSELHYSNLYISRMAGPVYSLVVKGVQLGAIGDGGDISSFVSVDVTVENKGLRSAAAELIGSVFMNGTSASDIVRLDLQAEPEGAEGLEKTYTVMIPYSSEDFQQSMREIKDLYLVVRDTFSCHLFRVAIHFHTDVERANRPSFQTWRALPLPRCGTCELFGASADRDNPMTQASPVCNEIKDVTFLKPIRTRIVDSKTVTINSSRPASTPNSTSSAASSGPKAQIDQQSISTSILPSSVSWSGPVAMASLAGFALLVVLVLFVRHRRGKKKPSRKKSTFGVHKRRTVQYARIDEDAATPKDRQLKYDDDEDFDRVDAECGESGVSVVSRSRSSSQDIV
ncbi:Carboxypeptidase T [Phytophthora citrophthora]|uniref:Carboxypeptidase T n=1 Tax=Phytophthora citrophthora TaxID=4793 RepID=A0AAD9GNT2_9STRA|nr:Carboxypeptidase T [Phytophthora citrophthora]